MDANPPGALGFLGTPQTGAGMWAEQWEEGSRCAEHQNLTKTLMRVGVVEWGKHPLGLGWGGCAGVQNTFHPESSPACTVLPSKGSAPPFSAPHPAPQPSSVPGSLCSQGSCPGRTPLLPEAGGTGPDLA